MRDTMPNKSLMTDPVTGSTLILTGSTGRGGAVYQFEYRKTPAEGSIPFYVVDRSITNFMLDRHREKRGLPNLDALGIMEWKEYLSEFAEEYGLFSRVVEWYLIGADGRPLMAPADAQRTWNGFTLTEAQQIIDTFYRVYFELTARRPGATSEDPAERYYPDLLEFNPYNLPKQLVQKRRAAPGAEVDCATVQTCPPVMAR